MASTTGHPVPPYGAQRFVGVRSELQDPRDRVDLCGVPAHRVYPAAQALRSGWRAEDMLAEVVTTEANVNVVAKRDEQACSVTEMEVHRLAGDTGSRCDVGNP